MSEHLKLRITDIPSTKTTLPIWIGSENNLSMAAVYGKENTERIVACVNFCAGLSNFRLTQDNIQTLEAKMDGYKVACDLRIDEVKALQSRAEQAEQKIRSLEDYVHTLTSNEGEDDALTVLKRACEKEFASVQKLDAENQKLKQSIESSHAWLLKWGYLGEPMTVTGLAFDELRTLLSTLNKEAKL